MPKPVVSLEDAVRDVEEIAATYHRDNVPQVAEAFTHTLSRAYEHISYNPSAGSPGYAETVKFPNLRFYPLRNFPYLVFYVERSHCIEVCRVVHGRRAASLTAEFMQLRRLFD